MRVAALLVAIGLVTAACVGDDSTDGARSFDLQGEEADRDSLAAAELSADLGRLTAVVVEAPKVVTAGDDVEVVIELRNPTEAPLSLQPCPTWEAWVADNGPTRLVGNLPCDEIERIEEGEQIRLRLTIEFPTQVECHDGYDPEFSWQLRDAKRSDIRASVGIPMRESDSASANDCGAPTTAPPPDLERT